MARLAKLIFLIIFLSLFSFVGVVVLLVITLSFYRKNKAQVDQWIKQVTCNIDKVSFTGKSRKVSSNGEDLIVGPAIGNAKTARNGSLSARQSQIFESIRASEKSSMKQLASLFQNISDRTLRRDLSKIEALGLIEQVGKTKNSYYILKK
jgi:predicted HTH transcriptional regulator